MPIRRAVVNYIKNAHEEGYEYVQIQQELVRAGYPERDINDSMVVAVQHPELLEPRPHYDPVYAGLWTRAGAAAIDTAILLATLLVIHISMGLLGMPFVPTIDAINGALGFVMLLELVGIWAYSAHLEASSWQATIGKRVAGLQVTDEYGFQVDFNTAAIRSAGKFASALPALAGFIMLAFTKDHQALHDMLAKTRVVQA